MNILTQRRPEDEDPLNPGDPLALPGPLGQKVLSADSTNAGSGGSAPPPAAAVPGAVIFQQPERSDRSETKGPQESYKYKAQSPESAKALESSAAAGAKALDAATVTGGADVNLAEAERLAAEKQAINEQLRANERAQAQERRQEIINAKMAERETAQKDHEANGKMTTFWEDKGVPAKIFAALMVGLNGYANSGRGMPGGNKAYEILQNAEAADRQNKIDNYTRSKEYLDLKKQGVLEAQEGLKNELLSIDDKSIARGKMLAAESLAVAKRLGIPKAIAAATDLQAKVMEKNADTALKQRQVYERDISHEGEQTTTGRTINTAKAPGAAGAKDLTVPLPDGTVRQGRSPEEAAHLRSQSATLEAARVIAEKLKALGQQKGRLPSPELSNQIAIEANNLMEKKKELTGALNEGDRTFFQDKVVPGLMRGADSTGKGIDSYVDSLASQLSADVKMKTVEMGSSAAAAQTSPQSSRSSESPVKGKPVTKVVGGKTMVMVNGRLKVEE